MNFQVDILQQVLIRMLVKRYKKSGMSRKMQRMVIAVVGDEVMTLPATGESRLWKWGREQATETVACDGPGHDSWPFLLLVSLETGERFGKLWDTSYEAITFSVITRVTRDREID